MPVKQPLVKRLFLDSGILDNYCHVPKIMVEFLLQNSLKEDDYMDFFYSKFRPKHGTKMAFVAYSC